VSGLHSDIFFVAMNGKTLSKVLDCIRICPELGVLEEDTDI
jgi:hypothetical protein